MVFFSNLVGKGKPFVLLVGMLFAFSAALFAKENPTLKGKIICLDPGHGGTADSDHYRVGPTGEREEWVNLRVAFYLRELLQNAGAKVVMTRETDVHIPLQERAEIAKTHQADIFVSIHHNATADTNVNFPIIYFHGQKSENQASILLADHIGESLRTLLFGGQGAIGIISDQVIFPGAGAAVLRHTYGIPAVIGEASFFSHGPEEHRLKDTLFNKLEAKAYFEALEVFFSQYVKGNSAFSIVPKNSIISEITPFRVAQEADRMDDDGKDWLANYETAKVLADPILNVSQTSLSDHELKSLQKAYDLFSKSVRFFPDSWLAGSGHAYRAAILQKLGNLDESEMENRRANEHFVFKKKLN